MEDLIADEFAKFSSGDGRLFVDGFSGGLGSGNGCGAGDEFLQFLGTEVLSDCNVDVGLALVGVFVDIPGKSHTDGVADAVFCQMKGWGLVDDGHGGSGKVLSGVTREVLNTFPMKIIQEGAKQNGIA